MTPADQRRCMTQYNLLPENRREEISDMLLRARPVDAMGAPTRDDVPISTEEMCVAFDWRTAEKANPATAAVVPMRVAGDGEPSYEDVRDYMELEETWMSPTAKRDRAMMSEVDKKLAREARVAEMNAVLDRGNAPSATCDPYAYNPEDMNCPGRGQVVKVGNTLWKAGPMSTPDALPGAPGVLGPPPSPSHYTSTQPDAVFVHRPWEASAWEPVQKS